MAPFSRFCIPVNVPHRDALDNMDGKGVDHSDCFRTPDKRDLDMRKESDGHMPDDATLTLGTEKIPTLLVRYSVPAITSMVLFSLYNIIDSIFIGHGVGPLGIAGVAVSFPIMNLTIAFGVLIGIGGSSVASILLGRRDVEGAFQVLGNAAVLGLLNGLVLGCGMFVFLDKILTIFGASPDVLPYARDFMQIILLALPVTYTLFGLNHLMRASGHPKKAMLSITVTVGVNIILAPIFIFHFGWGMRGAALATVAAQCCGAAWVLAHFCNRTHVLHFKAGIYRLRLSIIRSICSIGAAPFLVSILASAVVAVITMELRDYGGDLAIAAYGIVNRVLFLFVMVVLGLTQGMQPIIGYNYGALQLDRVKMTLKYGMITATLIMATGMLAGGVFPDAIGSMFTTDEQLLAISTTGLRIGVLAFPLVGIQVVISNFFQSMGMAKLSIFLTIARQLLYLLPCLFILPHFLGLNGIWFSLPISDALAFLTAGGVLIKYRKAYNVAQ